MFADTLDGTGGISTPVVFRDIGIRRIDDSEAIVDVVADWRVELPSPGRLQKAEITGDFTGPMVLSKIDDVWKVADLTQDGVSMRQAVHMDVGARQRAGSLELRVVAVQSWSTQTIVIASVTNTGVDPAQLFDGELRLRNGRRTRHAELLWAAPHLFFAGASRHFASASRTPVPDRFAVNLIFRIGRRSIPFLLQIDLNAPDDDVYQRPPRLSLSRFVLEAIPALLFAGFLGQQVNYVLGALVGIAEIAAILWIGAATTRRFHL